MGLARVPRRRVPHRLSRFRAAAAGAISLYFTLKGHRVAENPRFATFDKLMRVYLALLIPFCFFSYMMFSDRYILQVWLLLPMVICWPFLYIEKTTGPLTSAVRFALLLAVAVLPNIIDYGASLLRVCQELL